MVEFRPEDDFSKPGIENGKLNLQAYLEFIRMAKNRSVDVLVFSEATLNYYGASTADFIRIGIDIKAADNGVDIPCEKQQSGVKCEDSISFVFS